MLWRGAIVMAYTRFSVATVLFLLLDRRDCSYDLILSCVADEFVLDVLSNATGELVDGAGVTE
jgi:hypothetical protein